MESNVQLKVLQNNDSSLRHYHMNKLLVYCSQTSKSSICFCVVDVDGGDLIGWKRSWAEGVDMQTGCILGALLRDTTELIGVGVQGEVEPIDLIVLLKEYSMLDHSLEKIHTSNAEIEYYNDLFVRPIANSIADKPHLIIVCASPRPRDGSPPGIVRTRDGAMFRAD